MKRGLAGVAVALMASAAWLVAGTVGASAATTGLLRVAYLAPAAPNADIYVDGTVSSPNAPYKTVTTYIPVAAGAHTVSIHQAGSGTSAIQTSVNVGADQRWTVVVGGQWSSMQMASFQDATATPPAGKAEVRFIHTALQVPGVDVAVKNGPIVFHNISFMQASPYAAVAAGPYQLQLKATGTTEVLFSAPEVSVSAGQVVTLVGVGGVAAPVQLLTMNDAAAAGTDPSGGAGTGGGGASPVTRDAEIATVLILLGLAGVAGVSYFDARRRRAQGSAA